MYSKLLEILGLSSNKIKSQIFEECFIRNLSKDEAEKVYKYYENFYTNFYKCSHEKIMDINISDIVETIILKLNLTTP